MEDFCFMSACSTTDRISWCRVSILLGQNWLSHISWTALGMSNCSLPQVGSIWKFYFSFTFEKFKYEQNTLSNTPGHSSDPRKIHEINVVMLREGMCKCFCCPNTMLRFNSQELDSMWVLQWATVIQLTIRCTYTRIISTYIYGTWDTKSHCCHAYNGRCKQKSLK